MAATKYLDYDGLLYFWTLIKGKLALKADKAITLSGYGITDAKISNGTITLTIKRDDTFGDGDDYTITIDAATGAEAN